MRLKFRSTGEKIPVVKAILWIVLSTFFISTTSYHLLKRYYSPTRSSSVSNRTISYIVQTGPQREALHSDYFAESLGLSLDHPVSFSSFSVKEATDKLKRSPILRDVSVTKLKPNILYIDYTVRRPIAWIYDYFNVAIDKEGYVFPIHPFFPPKKLPEIYLGLAAFSQNEGNEQRGSSSWNNPLTGKYIDLAFSILDLLNEHAKDLFTIKRIDVSQSFAPTYGKREIVVVTKNEIPFAFKGQELHIEENHILRLSAQQYSQDLANYLLLRPSLLEKTKEEVLKRETLLLKMKDKVIDLRIAHIAFIE